MQTPVIESPASDGLARVREAQRFLALSRSAVYDLMDKGELQYVKIGKARRIPWPALRELIEKNRISA
jgi:excisionase family DNA binding protein